MHPEVEYGNYSPPLVGEGITILQGKECISPLLLASIPKMKYVNSDVSTGRDAFSLQKKMFMANIRPHKQFA